MPVLGIILVLSGLAIWKPVTLGFITALFVNYKWARFVHFVAMALLLLLALVHVFMVFTVDPYSLRVDGHGLVQPGALTRSAQCASLLSSVRAAAPLHPRREVPPP